MRQVSCHMKRKRGAASPIGLRSVLSCASVVAILAVSTPTWAQSKNSQSLTKPATTLLEPSEKTADFVGLSPSLSGAMIELPADVIGSSLFELDISQQDCLSGSKTCVRADAEKLNMIYNKPIKGLSLNGLDLQLTPRASVSFDDDTSSALVGALVRIGDDLREGSDLDSNTWYFFAGADAEAVTYSPNSVSRMTSGNFHLQDRIIVGDAQAGIGYRIGDADVSLGYFRREVTSFSSNDPTDDFSMKEDAAALSFTWRR